MNKILIQLRKHKQDGGPALFFIDYNDAGWWLECYDRFGHSECCRSYLQDQTVSATFDEDANRFALKWARLSPACEIEVVETLAPPADLPYIGN